MLEAISIEVGRAMKSMAPAIFVSIRFSILTFVVLFSAVRASSQEIAWKNALKQDPKWYGSAEALRVADNLLLYQRAIGGWPKNIDMSAPLSETEKARLLAIRSDDADATIDNSATYTQLIFLARVFTVRPEERYRKSFLNGVDYLLKAQYPNGGWPQYYPNLSGYYKHITYNDDAMIGVMKLLRDIAERKREFKFVDEVRRNKAERAVQKGIECILQTQVIVNGKRTVWCAQHDERTLAPAPARKFEPVSLSGGESVGIVRFLMSIDKPSPQLIGAVRDAIAWFEQTKLTGIKWVEKPDASKLHGFDRVVIIDPEGGPLWARFYEIPTNKPIFVGRDSVVKYDVAEIEDERRNGYAWYVDGGKKLLSEDYPKWLSRNGLH